LSDGKKEKKVDGFITLSMRKKSKFYQVSVKSATWKNKYYRQITSETKLRKATAGAKQKADALDLDKDYNFLQHSS